LHVIILKLGVPGGYPSAINYRPGSLVVKGPSGNQLYVIQPGNTVAPISDSVAKQLYGTNYKVTTIAPREWSQYICKKTGEVTKAHPGMTVKLANSATIYYIDSQNVKHEVTASGMSNNFLLSNYVFTVSDSMLQGITTGDTITSAVWHLTDRTGSGINCDGSSNGSGGNGGGSGGNQEIPSVTFTNPNNNATVKDVVTISANATDNVGVSKVEFWAGNSLVSSDATSPYSTDWNTKNFAEGNITLQAKAFDAAGNIGTATINVTINNTGNGGNLDTQAPQINISTPTNGATVKDSITITANASDNVGVSKMELYANNVLLSSNMNATTLSANWKLYQSVVENT
jgi:hypothetical protein